MGSWRIKLEGSRCVRPCTLSHRPPRPVATPSLPRTVSCAAGRRAVWERVREGLNIQSCLSDCEKGWFSFSLFIFYVKIFLRELCVDINTRKVCSHTVNAPSDLHLDGNHVIKTFKVLLKLKEIHPKCIWEGAESQRDARCCPFLHSCAWQRRTVTCSAASPHSPAQRGDCVLSG